MAADGGDATEKAAARRMLRMWGCWGMLPLGWRRARAVKRGAVELNLDGHGRGEHKGEKERPMERGNIGCRVFLFSRARGKVAYM